MNEDGERGSAGKGLRPENVAQSGPQRSGSQPEERSLSLNRFGAARGDKRLWCPWPWSTLVLTCDGTVVCGCGDAFNENPMGDARTQTVRQIWQGAGFQRMRSGMLENEPAPFCRRCGLMELHPPDWRPPDSPIVPEDYPEVLYVEPTILCTLRCPQPACDPKQVHPTRRMKLLPFDLYTKVFDELAPRLKRLVLYNYGESFVHPDAARMIRYARSRDPDLLIWTSTNGQQFDTAEKVRDIVESGVSEIQFSLDGVTQEVYERYRRRGNLAKALDGMRAIIEERDRRGLPHPRIVWNYILFDWNDSDEEMERAKALAIQLGVDRFTWTVTDQPLGMPSRRFVPGTEDYERIRPGLVGGGARVPNAIRWQARIEPVFVPRRARIGESLKVFFRVTNEGDSVWMPPRGTPHRGVFLGLDLVRPDGILATDSFMRQAVPRPMGPGESEIIQVSAQVSGPSGSYRLEVDLMWNSVWWLSHLGREPQRLDLEILEPGASIRSFERIEAPRTVRGDEGFEIRVRVRNPLANDLDGSGPVEGRDGIGIRWIEAATGRTVRDAERVFFVPPLQSDGVREITIHVPAGALPPGSYRAKIDMIKEYCFWFVDRGLEPATIDVEVK